MGIFGFILLIALGAYAYKAFFAGRPFETKDERFNAEKARQQKELDWLLDKINQRGIDNLSEQERRRLDELSGKK